MAFATTKNGPAEAATSPSHGSSNPAKDQNMKTTTTAPVAPARDTAVANAMYELAPYVCDLHNMARILGDLLDETLVEYRQGGQKICMPEKGRALKVLIGHDQMEMLSFAWNDVISKAKGLRDRYNAAHDAGVAA